MASFKVKSAKLNVRTAPVEDFRDKGNIIGKLLNDAPFESVNEKTNKLGQWLQDVNGHWAWRGGLFESKPSFIWFQKLQIETIWRDFNELGDEATIAILDTGYDFNNIDLPTPALTKLFVDNFLHNATMQDVNGHGTFCSSLVATKNTNNFIGIAPLCKLLVGKISLIGDLQNLDIILDGVNWAIQSGADVISISLGIPLDLENEINDFQARLNEILKDRNVLIFAASGDSDSDEVITKDFYPASFNNCISIGTVTNNQLDNITVRSNKTILHTVGRDIEAYGLNSVIEKLSGTSMSVPIISAVAALGISSLKKKKGKWDKQELLEKLIDSSDVVIDFPNKKNINPTRFIQSL